MFQIDKHSRKNQQSQGEAKNIAKFFRLHKSKKKKSASL